ncbi:MAG TPA: PA14 domain-containing protein [Chitinophagaceae bacterium]|nr:PA14 domain-containing protein [Chitinophagaceae bacterium]
MHAQNDSLAFGDKKKIPDGLKGKIYFLAENTEKLPYFDTLKSMGELYVKKLDIPERPWTTGFPGVSGRNEWFAIVYTGYFRVKKAGHFTFRLLSDDGAKLYIDGKLVINNDGIHGPGARLGDVDLNSSKHSIRVEYFQGPAVQIALQLFVTMGNEVEQIFPGDNFVLSSPADSKSSWLKYGLYIAILLILLLLFVWWKRRSKKHPTPKPA